MDLFFVLLILSLGVYSVDADCNSPENISFATLVVVGSSPYPDGTQVEYTCNIGYRAYGDGRFYTCQGGVWVGNFECKKITCSYKSPPANGKYSTSPTYEIGTEMRLECNSGYDRNGPSRLLCMADGTWDPDQETECTPKNCRDFGSVINGDARQNIQNGIRNSYGSVVTITCDESYVIVGSPHVECQASGSWGAKPSCELVSCPTYPGASTGCVDYTELSGNNRFLVLFCKSGPNISVTQLGEYDVYCNDNQVWEGDQLACYCDCRVVVNETRVTVNNLESNGFLKHGRKLDWTCKKGLKNMTENVVCNDGVIGTNLCDGSCLSNPSVENTEDPTSDPPYPENTHLDLECIREYHQLEGTSKRYTCIQNDWSGNLTCKQTFCPSHPDVTNGTLVNPKTKYLVDYKLEFVCDPTYRLEADLNVTCLPNGTWSSFNQTKCVAVCESYPHVDNATVVSHCAPCLENSHIDLSCNQGFHTNTQRYTCNQHVWNGNLTCKQMFCPSYPNITNGFLVNPQPGYPVGYELKFRCDPTYTLERDSEVTCLPNGTWSSSIPTTCVAVCESCPQVDNARNVSHCTPPYLENSHLDLSCIQGYHKNTQHYTCNQHEWNGNLTCKQIFCPSYPNITNGFLVNPKADYPVDYKLEFGCEPTYTLIEDSEVKVTCLQNGTWSSSNQATCKRLCASHPLVDNTVKVSGPLPYPENAHLDLECSPGYRQMVGTKTLYTCYPNKWNGNLTCEQIFCPNVSNTVPKVQLVNPQSNYPVGYKLKFRCDPAYTLEEDSEVNCLPNGEWSSSNQTKCVAVCESCPQVDNAVVVSHCTPPYLENSHLDLSCIQGYHKNTQRYICNQHVWNGNLTCKQIFCPSYPNITNGFLVNPKADYPVDYKLEFGCEPTYTLIEDSEVKVTCLQNGTWSSSNQATCIQGTWKPADPLGLSIGKKILLVVPGLVGLLLLVLIIVLLIWFIQYRMITKVISNLLNGAKMIAGVLLVKKAVPEPINTLEDTWNPLKDCFGKFVCEKMKCKLTELAEQMKNLWKVSWENLRSQVKEDLVKVKKYKTDAKDMFQAGNDFKGNVDQLLKSAKVATTISLYEPHWFSILIQTKPESYVNEQTKAKRRILEVEKTWSFVQKERGDEIYNMNNNLDKMEMELKLLEEKIKTKECELGSLNSQKRGLEQEVIELKKRQDLTQEEKISKIKALEAEIEIVKQKIEKKKKEIENLQENINRLTKDIATKTEELKILISTFQSDESWEPFTLLYKSLETIMHFWSKKPDSGEEEETLL